MSDVVHEADVCLVGAGLQNGLIALALQNVAPELRIILIERNHVPFGNHTWSWFGSDAMAQPTENAPHATLAPLAATLAEHAWPGYDVRFPAYRRHVSTRYHSMRSDHLRTLLAQAQGPHLQLVTGFEVSTLTATIVEGVLRSAEGAPARRVRVRARVVVDGRGAPAIQPTTTTTDCGYQRFVGLEVTCAAPHGVANPLLMDASVPQCEGDGYRFVYVLPLSATRLLVEDTYYSHHAAIDQEQLKTRILSYCRAHGWDVTSVDRVELGCLPLPWAGPGPGQPAAAAASTSGDVALAVGYRGAWFHPVTGYSFPLAWRLAQSLATTALADWPSAYAALAQDYQRNATMARRLNAMMFHWFEDTKRASVFAHFYRLPKPSIERFYRLQLRWHDWARLFIGRPPRGIKWGRVLRLPSPHRRLELHDPAR